jgi:hypothetical protein
MSKALIEKLSRIQSKLKAPKSQYNSFGKYAYRNQEDILEAVKPLLASENLVQTITDEMVLVGDRVYVKASVTITDGESSVTNSAFAREDSEIKGMSVAQITGAASSYARKYALNGMYAIDDTKDADSTNTHGKEDSKSDSKKEVPKQEAKQEDKPKSRFQPKGKAAPKAEENADDGGWS